MPTFYRNIFLFLIFTIGLFPACDNSEKEPDNKQVSRDTFIRANKAMVKTEDQKIQDYIDRYKWDMITTKTGLRYMIYEFGRGNLPSMGQSISFKYTSSLLNGFICYSSDETGPKTIIIGKGEVERGLEEGILLLKKGDRAKFIIPSHLAFGLVGDGAKIPAKATIIYDIEIIQIN